VADDDLAKQLPVNLASPARALQSRARWMNVSASIAR
jgi:hypothetical protein